MLDIKEVRRRFQLILAILVAFCALAAGILFSPIGSSSRTRQQRLDQLRAELHVKTTANGPLERIDAKLVDARGEIDHFYRERLPSSYASIAERLGAVAAENGVSLATGHYKSEASGVPGLERVIISASITGNYLHAVKFINAAERENMFFVIDSVSFSQQQGRTVQLQILIEAFRKDA